MHKNNHKTISNLLDYCKKCFYKLSYKMCLKSKTVFGIGTGIVLYNFIFIYMQNPETVCTLGREKK